jgi:hypothetical protein
MHINSKKFFKKKRPTGLAKQVKFKYQGITQTDKNCIHKEINSTVNVGNV